MVHINRTARNGWYYVSAWCKPIDPSKYPYKYAVPMSIINKIENGGRVNVNYWLTIRDMIDDITFISKRKLIKRSYYKTY